MKPFKYIVIILTLSFTHLFYTSALSLNTTFYRIWNLQSRNANLQKQTRCNYPTYKSADNQVFIDTWKFYNNFGHYVTLNWIVNFGIMDMNGYTNLEFSVWLTGDETNSYTYIINYPLDYQIITKTYPNLFYKKLQGSMHSSFVPVYTGNLIAYYNINRMLVTLERNTYTKTAYYTMQYS